jgi:hypothetical protein
MVPLSRGGVVPGMSHGTVNGLYQPICGSGTKTNIDAPVKRV